MTAEELEAGREFGRYLDVDGDGIPYRTYPGTHPTKGAFFTRGTSRDRYARYTEEGADYVDNMQRLLRKFETAQGARAGAGRRDGRAQPTRYGVIYFGSTAPAMDEALEALEAAGHPSRRAARPRLPVRRRGVRLHRRARPGLRGRAEPRRAAAHAARQRVRRSIRRGSIPVLHYDGTPITARFIVDAIAEQLARAHRRCRCKDAAE